MSVATGSVHNKSVAESMQTPIILGGPWTIVQVDESFKPKISYHGTKS